MDQEEHEALVEKALHFPDGLSGVPDFEHFVIAEYPEDGAFPQLKSLEDIDVSMGAWVPSMFFPAYAPVLSGIEQAELELKSADTQFTLSQCRSTLDHTRCSSTRLDSLSSTQRRQSGDSWC
jgi:flagellar assembly factor FliW